MKKIVFALIGISLMFLFYLNKERYILSHLNTMHWDLYKSQYKYKFSTYNPKESFRKEGVYVFSWDGECNYYLHNIRRNKLFKYQADDVEVSNKWKYINDTTFDLNGDKYKILYFKKDSIVLLWNNRNWLDTLILVPSPIRIKIGKSNGGVDSR
jgi:AAA15 family ATPase/GTPase